LERFRAKWKPVRVKKTRQNKRLARPQVPNRSWLIGWRFSAFSGTFRALLLGLVDQKAYARDHAVKPKA
jgi:hypothetical protein